MSDDQTPDQMTDKQRDAIAQAIYSLLIDTDMDGRHNRRLEKRPYVRTDYASMKPREVYVDGELDLDEIMQHVQGQMESGKA